MWIVNGSVAACVPTIKVRGQVKVKLGVFIENHILLIFFEATCWLLTVFGHLRRYHFDGLEYLLCLSFVTCVLYFM